MKKLKFCPFCGNETIHDDDANGWLDAYEKWNGRAFTGKLLSRTEISQIISQDNMVGYIETCGLNVDERQSIYNRIATAIHSAQMGKLGGVR